jgi:hypothetical protein
LSNVAGMSTKTRIYSDSCCFIEAVKHRRGIPLSVNANEARIREEDGFLHIKLNSASGRAAPFRNDRHALAFERRPSAMDAAGHVGRAARHISKSSSNAREGQSNFGASKRYRARRI